MSVKIHKHLYCDSCHLPWDEAVDGSFTIPHQRQMAKRDGWKRLKLPDGRLGDICGSCAIDKEEQP